MASFDLSNLKGWMENLKLGPGAREKSGLKNFFEIWKEILNFWVLGFGKTVCSTINIYYGMYLQI